MDEMIDFCHSYDALTYDCDVWHFDDAIVRRNSPNHVQWLYNTISFDQWINENETLESWNKLYIILYVSLQ